ncbi:MAG: diguanylate cyclase [Pirellulaceae bacterium]|nr:diguanylate cyclase [Pirellulaceae bacterium]
MGKITCKTSQRAEEVDEQRPLRILLIETNEEDNQQFRAAVASCQMNDFVVTNNNTHEAIVLAGQVEFDIVVVGSSHSAASILDSVSQFREACPSIPQIILTEAGNEQTVQALIDAGAQDYLVKPIANDCSIRQRILYAIARHAMSIADRIAIQQLQATSQVDGLTKLLNRTAFNRESERQMAIANRNGTSLSVGMIDVDFFKTINDKYGHMVGDQVLVGLSALLTQSSRVSDIPCRFGGEEFCVILPDTDDEQAFGWASRVCRTIRESKIDTKHGPISVTVSIGTATLAKGATSIDDALDKADAGCIEAKGRGRNQVVVVSSNNFFDPSKSGKHVPLLEHVRASDFMSAILLTAHESTSITKAARLMIDCRCEVVPVVTSSGTLSGLLSNEEIVSHILRGGRWDDAIELIAGQTVTFPENTPFSQIWGLFQRLPIRRAVVTRGDQPVGIINRGQLLSRLAPSLEMIETPSVACDVQTESLRLLFDEVKRTADRYLHPNSDGANIAEQDFSIVVAASQLQELASQLLELSSPTQNRRSLEQNRRSKLATSSASALLNL